MLEFTQIQEAFPTHLLELREGKIYLDELLIQTRWPTAQELSVARFYHGDDVDSLYLELIRDDIQFRIEAQEVGFELALEASRERLKDKFGKK